MSFIEGITDNINLKGLSPFQKMFLVYDGTLTRMLETYLNEDIHVVKLSENIYTTEQEIVDLKLPSNCKVIEREILLQGKESKQNWLYAKSIIAFDRLDDNFKDKLINSRIPIGKLWIEYQTETFKEIISSTKEVSGDLSKYFIIDKTDKLLSRTYRVSSNHQPVMVITEKFPENYFINTPT